MNWGGETNAFTAFSVLTNGRIVCEVWRFVTILVAICSILRCGSDDRREIRPFHFWH